MRATLNRSPPRIAALGRRVIAPDMRGRGRSANDPDPAHYVPAVYAQDVLTLIDGLEIPEAVFIGTSMGGIITMVVAALAPDRVAAAVLNDIGPGSSRTASRASAPMSDARRPVDELGRTRSARVRAIAGAAFPDTHRR